MKYEDFGDNTLAQIHYAHDLPPSEALAFVTKQFDDGSFRKHTRDWLFVLGALGRKPEVAAAVGELHARLVSWLRANPAGQEAHELAPMLRQPVRVAQRLQRPLQQHNVPNLARGVEHAHAPGAVPHGRRGERYDVDAAYPVRTARTPRPRNGPHSSRAVAPPHLSHRPDHRQSADDNP